MFAAINQKVTLVADFGTAYAGLATVGYTLYNGDGTTFQARATTGVTETVANVTGAYRVELSSSVFAAVFDGYVVWDTGSSTPVYAHEDIVVTDRLDTAVSGVASSVWQQTGRTLSTNPRAED